MVGKWYKFIGKSYENFTNGKYYLCISSDIDEEGAFIDNNGDKNGFSRINNNQFDLSNPMDHNPDEVKEEKKVYPIGGFAHGNYNCTCVTCKKTFQGDKRAVQCEPCAIEMVSKKEESKPEKRCDTITIVLFPDGCTQIITTLTKFECIEELKKVLESEIKKINEGN
jgi:hypothetical protein